MKKAKQALSLLLAAVMALAPTACAPAAEEDGAPVETPQATPAQAEGGLYTPGEYSATQTGFGGDVTVTMTFDENAITNVVVVGDGETAGIGSRAVEDLPQSILDAQSAEVDGIAGATVSSNAILSAAKECIQLASGTTLDTNVTLVPGTYTGSATGYFKVHPVEVSVTVDEEGITDIVIEEGHDETYGMVQSVTQNLLPRMIKYNSVTVDGITGATATSNAVKLAAAEALDVA